MANVFAYEGPPFLDYDLTFSSPPYNMKESMVDQAVAYIDPNLQSASPPPFGNPWGQPVQRFLKDTQKTYFLTPMSGQITNRTHLRPTVGIPVVPQPSQTRFASPISSIDPASAGCGLSPPADTESYYDNFPRTPPDTNLASPFQAPLSLEPYSDAHAAQFIGMGPDFVNPLDVSPSQSDYSESDNDIVDFNYAPSGYSFDNHPASNCSTQTTGVLDLTSRGMPSTAEEEIEVSSQYPPLLQQEGEVTELDEEPTLPTLKRQNREDTDGDYQPRKKSKPNSRTPGRRGAKINSSPTSSSRPPRRRNRAGTARGAAFSCPDCDRRDFALQSELDVHIKKQHKRPFHCVFDFAGCDSTFASKNEWKRHVSSQHLLLNYWVCTEGACAKASSSSSSPTPCSPPPTNSPTTTTKPNPPTGTIFNRKDLFTQHLKRMHAPAEIKALPPSFSFFPTASSSSPSNSKKTPTTTAPSHGNTKTLTAETARALADWEQRVRHLQPTCIRPRCALPTYMECPAVHCGAVFRGVDAWNQRMEHVARHLERASQGQGNEGEVRGTDKEKQKEKATGKEKDRVVFGGAGDQTLVDWAKRRDVAIIEPRKGDGEEGWVLKSVLRRGPGGNVVVLAPVSASVGKKNEDDEKGEEREDEKREQEEDGVEGEIVVGSSSEGDELLHAEGEDD